MLVSDSRNKRAHLHPCDEPCPPQTAREIEDYEVDPASVKILKLVIVPDMGGGKHVRVARKPAVGVVPAAAKSS